MRMKDHVLCSGRQPYCADAIIVTQRTQLDDAEASSTTLSHGAQQLLEREDATQGEVRHGRSDGLIKVHGVLTLFEGIYRRLLRFGGRRHCSTVCAISSSRNLLIAWSALGEMSPRVRAA